MDPIKSSTRTLIFSTVCPSHATEGSHVVKAHRGRLRIFGAFVSFLRRPLRSDSVWTAQCRASVPSTAPQAAVDDPSASPGQLPLITTATPRLPVVAVPVARRAHLPIMVRSTSSFLLDTSARRWPTVWRHDAATQRGDSGARAGLFDLVAMAISSMDGQCARCPAAEPGSGARLHAGMHTDQAVSLRRVASPRRIAAVMVRWSMWHDATGRLAGPAVPLESYREDFMSRQRVFNSLPACYLSKPDSPRARRHGGVSLDVS